MRSTIRECLQEALVRYKVPGLAAHIVHGRETLFAGGVGHFDRARCRPITADTRFGVASLTKFVTCLVMLLLQEQGRLGLDDRVSQHLPSLKFARRTPIRIRHLLSHSGGLPGLPSRFLAADLNAPESGSGGIANASGDGVPAAFADRATWPVLADTDALIEFLNRLEVEPLAPPGEILNYSNEGFCLLGGIAERIMHRPFAELAQEMVFDPLDMRESVVGGTRLSRSDPVAFPLLRHGSEFADGMFWQAPLFYPAGGLVSSARDIVCLMSTATQGSSLLNAESMQRLSELESHVPSRPLPAIGYSLGLEYHRLGPTLLMLWHSGQRAGVSSFMASVPEAQFRVSVLCNVADIPVSTIGHELIAAALDLDACRWPPAALADDGVNHDMNGFEGSYVSGEGRSLTVASRNGQLVLAETRTAEAADFRFAGPDFGVVADQTFRFLPGDKGAPPWALALDLRVFKRAPTSCPDRADRSGAAHAADQGGR